MQRKNRDTIPTGRLCLRSISDGDVEDMIALLANKEIAKTYMLPEFQSREEIIKLFERLKALSESKEHFVYGIDLQGHIIGFLNDVQITKDTVEVGYVIHPDYKNQGFATEAFGAVIQALFDAGFRVVTAGAFVENPASFRVMEKCGMQKSTLEEDIDYRGQTHHCLYYAKER